MQIVSIVLLALFLPKTRQQGLLEGLIKFFIESSKDYVQDDVEILPEYDFVIIGAGTAGCVLANRLSENPDWKILLIEAGGIERDYMDIPLAVHYLQLTKENWDYKALPSEKYCKSLKNSQCNIPRGKVMGGSSTINYMIYTRGSPLDYDNWAKMGNKGWSYEEVLPYFKKIENFKIDEFQDDRYHAKDGPLSIEYAPYRTNFSKIMMRALGEIGLEHLDYNGENMLGFSYLQTSMKNGMRHSANRAYIDPIKRRNNLDISKGSLVKKVLMDKRDLRAIGVEYVKEGRVFQVGASKEVIVSAGAVASPQILMLSGIGPKNHLRNKNIEVLKNLKVGYNLMDHVTITTSYYTINHTRIIVTTNTIFEETNMADYFNFRKGPLTLPGGCEIISFHNLDEHDPRPQIELLYVGYSISSDPLIYKLLGITENVHEKVLKPIKEIPNYAVFPVLLLPKSKGRIYLKDSNYKSKPLIFLNYFSHPQDLQYLMQAMKISINISQQPSMKKINSQFNTHPIPACAKHLHLSDKFLECVIRETTNTIYHQCGTCKMGPAGDKTAVVDERLRVHGINGLRVIDASIMPEIVAGHTNAPVYMIAEKGADMIKEDWGFLQIN